MSKIEVNQISSQCGSTLTIGQSGDTVTLASGATQTGFGRTGTVDWCTTAKTAPFTGVSGKGYFVNTTCGAVTVTLPATPTAGDIISLKDYGGTWQTNNVTLCNNGSKINGVVSTSTLSTQSQSVTLIYVDSTKGWQDIQDSTSNVSGSAFISATGGTITTCGDYKIHTFTSSGTFCVSAGSGPKAQLDYLVVAGGGAGGSGYRAGGAGAGGFRESHTVPVSGCYTASPLASSTPIPVSVQAYPVTIGAGGSPGTASATDCSNKGTNGSNSIFSTITSAGGGAGGSVFYPTSAPQAARDGNAGGSGGAGMGHGCGATSGSGGSGNTPPTSPSQGNNGGNGTSYPTCGKQSGGGGGGATAAGTSGPNPAISLYPGGAGATTSISGSPASYSGGGGGGAYNFASGGAGGLGGGGNGANFGIPCGPSAAAGTAGTANTGGGGGGAAGEPGPGNFFAGGAGGSGIVILRYKFQ